MASDTKQKLIKRLRIVGGQVRGLERMVEHDAYCVNIITQSLAIKEALSSIEDILLEQHLATHATGQMRSKHPQKAIREITKIFKLSKNK